MTTAARARRAGLWLTLLALLAGCVTSGQPTKVVYVKAPALSALDQQKLQPRYRVGLLAGDGEAEFLGQVTAESVAALRLLLQANPKLRVLQLTSPGGDVTAVQTLLPVLAGQHLTTFVPLACESACTMLFLAGERRELGAHGRLGFHRSYPSLAPSTSSPTSAGNTLMRQMMLAAGASTAFVDRVVATPPDQLWFPTVAELVAAKIVTQAAPQRHAASQAGDEVALVDWVLLNGPTERAFGEAYPASFATLRQALYAAFVAAPQDVERRQALISGAVDPAFAEALPHASDAAVLEFYRLLYDLVLEVEQRDPRQCVGIADFGATDSELDADLEWRFSRRLDHSAALVFLSYAQGGAAVPDRATAVAAADRFLDKLARSGAFTEAQVAAMDDPKGHPRIWCAAFHVLLEAALAEGEAGGVLALRGIFYR